MRIVRRAAAISSGDMPESARARNWFGQRPGSDSQPFSISRARRVWNAAFSSTIFRSWNAIEVACSNPSEHPAMVPTQGKRLATSSSPSSCKTSWRHPIRKSKSAEIFSKPDAIYSAVVFTLVADSCGFCGKFQRPRLFFAQIFSGRVNKVKEWSERRHG